MYLATIMAATAVFYGIEQQTIFQDIIASFLISRSSTALVFMGKKIFEKSRLRDKPSRFNSTTDADDCDATQRFSTVEHNIR